MTCSRIIVVLSALAIATTQFTAQLPAGDHSPEWRGNNGQGHSDAVDLPESWNETEHIAWKQKLPGLGWSTPVVENGQVWVTTAIDKLAPPAEAERRRKASTNSQPLRISESVSLRAVGLDLQTGEIIREVEVLSQQDPQMIHIDNTYATPSPIIENGRLYCHYGPCGIACLDINTGDVLWRNQSLVVKHENGAGSSPILWNDLLIIHCDGIDRQYIVALDKQTGEEVWKTPRTGKLHDNPQLRKSYATSLIVDINGQPQIVSPSADWIYGYDPSTGKELWKLNYGTLGFSNAARPVAGNGMIFTCTGYMKSQILAFKVDEQNKPTLAWRYKDQVPNVSCPLLVGDEIYFASDAGIATCIDSKTGKLHWKERIGKRFWAAPLYADGKIYFFDRNGTTTVIAPGTTFKKLSVNKLDGTLLSTAAAVDGSLILRTDQALHCIR